MMLQNLRFALRVLRRNPGFTLLATLPLALGIGATTTIFTVVNALLIRPLPVEAPGELVRLHATLQREGSEAEATVWSFPGYEDAAALDGVFSGVAARHGWSVRYESHDVIGLQGHAVTGNFFPLVGLRPVLGRTLLPSDDRSDEPAMVAVISRATWTTHFAADPGVLGRTMRLNGHTFTIVGVMGDERVFDAIGAPAVWVPIRTRASLESTNPIDTRNVAFIPQVVARLQPGVTLARAQAATAALTETSEGGVTRAVKVAPAGTLHGFALAPARADTLRSASVLLLAVVGIVLLIACANVANLLLVRALSRHHEMGVRAALGAGRGRLVGQLLTESVLLGLLGAAGGLWLAGLGLRLARGIPEVANLSPEVDGRVLAFTLATAVASGLLFGLAPAFTVRSARLMEALRSGRTATRRLRLQRVLIVGQIALALLLVVSAGLVVRTLRNLDATHPGFDPHRLLLANVSLPGGFEKSPGELAALSEGLLEEVRALPGVTGAGLATVAPLSGSRMVYGFSLAGYEPPPGEQVAADIATVDDGYFRVLGTPLVAGSGFESLPPGNTGSVLINETMARRYWAGRDPVGESFVMSDDTLRVLGVIGDLRHLAIGEEPVPTLYLRNPRMSYGFFTLHVRTAGDPALLVEPLRRLVQAATPGQPAPTVRPMAELVRDSLAEARIAAVFFSLLGALALILAAIGLYAVLAYSVAQRTREIGVRIALGAGVARVTGEVVRDSAVLVAVGVGCGLLAATAGTRLIRAVLYGVGPTDPVSFLLGAGALIAVGLLSAYLPARRAARVDPTIALRAE